MVTNVFDLLEREWVRLRNDRPAARRLADVRALAGGAASLADVEAYVRGAGPEDADAVLLALVRRAVTGDDLAARVLLQLLLPGTRNLARRWWALGDHEERAAAAVTAVYHRIKGYPVARRPGRIAANVLMDAARELRRAVPRVTVTLTADPAAADGPDGRGPSAYRGRDDAGPASHAAMELAEVLRDAVDDGVLERGDAELIARSRIAGHRVADIARHHHLGSRTLWDRRHRAERTLVAAHTAGTARAS
ncbi:MAG TPA: hypothetical protein VGO78_26250 [Acidimicrobiales bacterium]|nr:hypothetical protein [Acidimicrobiales bacterium]